MSVHVCVYDVGCFVDVLVSRSGYCRRKLSVPVIAVLLSSSMGISIEWLTGVSQVLGSRPDEFSCEWKIHLRLRCIHCVRAILSPGYAIPSLIFHYQYVCSCVCIWRWFLCRCACELERVLWGEAKCSNDCNTFKLLGGYVDRVTDWCVTGPGFAPRRVQLWMKNLFKALVYTLYEDNLVPWLRYSFIAISLSVCLFMCVYIMLVDLSMCLRVGVGIVGRS